MEKIIVTDLNGMRFLLDIKKAKELGIIEKEIKPLWSPKLKENYYYVSDNLLVKECAFTASSEAHGRKHKGNVFKTMEECELASNYNRGDINGIILKFAIENNCLATIEDIKSNDKKELYVIGYNKSFGCYMAYPLNEKEYIPHTVILSDGEKADKAAAILNEQELGFIKEENFEEQSVDIKKTIK